MAERPLPKPKTRVRFPSSAPKKGYRRKRRYPFFGADHFTNRSRSIFQKGKWNNARPIRKKILQNTARIWVLIPVIFCIGAGSVSARETPARRKDIRRRRNTRHFAMISVPCGTDDIPSVCIWFLLSIFSGSNRLPDIMNARNAVTAMFQPSKALSLRRTWGARAK